MEPDRKIREEIEREAWPDWMPGPDEAAHPTDEALLLRARLAALRAENDYLRRYRRAALAVASVVLVIAALGLTVWLVAAGVI